MVVYIFIKAKPSHFIEMKFTEFSGPNSSKKDIGAYDIQIFASYNHVLESTVRGVLE